MRVAASRPLVMVGSTSEGAFSSMNPSARVLKICDRLGAETTPWK